MLTVDRHSRLIIGRAIPWNVVSLVNSTWVALERDCLTWPESVPLLLSHDSSLIAGRVVDWESARDGLCVTLLVRNGPRGDRALASAEAGWGLSPSINVAEYEIRDSVTWCISGEAYEISLVRNPAFL